jgi:hypothetical protein
MLSKLQEKFLKDHGFRKNYCDDRSGYWWQRNLRVQFLKNPHLTIDNGHITLWSIDIDNKMWSILHRVNYSRKNLLNLLNKLK